MFNKKENKTYMEQIVDGQKTFVREVELLLHEDDKDEILLNIHQLGVGDEGCVVWDAALVLLKFLFTEKGKLCVHDRSVLELGAGTGVVGLTSLFAGASSVCITDLPRLLPLINVNIEANFDLIKTHRTDLTVKEAHSFHKVSAQSLCWGKEDDLENYFKFLSSMDHAKSTDCDKPSACVLIADCIYYEQGSEDLVKTIVMLLDKLSEESMVLCSYEYRTVGDKVKVLKHFFQLLKSHQIQIDFINHNDMDAIYRSDDIFIIKLQKTK